MNKLKLKIRKANPGDEIGIAEMGRQGFKRKNWLYTGSNTVPNKEILKKMRKQFAEKNGTNFAFVSIEKTNNKLIGSTFASFRKSGRLRHRVNLGWGVHPDYQNRGVATKLLKTTLTYARKKGFKRAEAEIAVKNIPSYKLAKKYGFKIEGKKKYGMLLDNRKYVDTYIMGRLL